jgi:Tfp pilus assembly protein PilO
MPPGDVAPVLVTSILFFSLAAVLILRGPLGRALARRIEGGAGGGEAEERTRALEERVAHLEGLQAQLAELEERLDFAERLLARAREGERLPAGEKRQ